MAVLLSIKPQYCELIASGKKIIELRKSRPKIQTPFKCYIYCTLSGSNEFFKEDCKGDIAEWNRSKMALKKGKVIGEFVCDNISDYPYFDSGFSISRGYVTITDRMRQKMCLDVSELEDYGNCKKLYGWHISGLIIYDNPKELSEFMHTRPPQSWYYVKELI